MNQIIKLVTVQIAPKLSFPHKFTKFQPIMINSSSIIGIEKVENLFMLEVDKKLIVNIDSFILDNFEHLNFYTFEHDHITKELYNSRLKI